MIKARASGSKVYLYFMKKGQAGETPHSAEFLFTLTHCILVDSSTVICWTSLGMSGLFCRFYHILMENPVSKHCRP